MQASSSRASPMSSTRSWRRGRLRLRTWRPNPDPRSRLRRRSPPACRLPSPSTSATFRWSQRLKPIRPAPVTCRRGRLPPSRSSSTRRLTPLPHLRRRKRAARRRCINPPAHRCRRLPRLPPRRRPLLRTRRRCRSCNPCRSPRPSRRPLPPSPPRLHLRRRSKSNAPCPSPSRPWSASKGRACRRG